MPPEASVYQVEVRCAGRMLWVTSFAVVPVRRCRQPSDLPAHSLSCKRRFVFATRHEVATRPAIPSLASAVPGAHRTTLMTSFYRESAFADTATSCQLLLCSRARMITQNISGISKVPEGYRVNVTEQSGNISNSDAKQVRG